MTSSKSSTTANSFKEWLLDVYLSEIGKVAVWVISEEGKESSLQATSNRAFMFLANKRT
jgi:hypothetical protein